MLLNLMYFSPNVRYDLRWLFNICAKCLVSLLVQLFLRAMFGHRCFITRYPTERQFNIRIVTISAFAFLSVLQLLAILLYSIKFQYEPKSSFKWLSDFVIGLIQSELGYSHVFTFSRSYINALFEIDPFAEEEAKVQLTSRVSVYNKFAKLSHQQTLS
jgi:energy-coupling factor transporter transmembrane protein EcfT